MLEFIKSEIMMDCNNETNGLWGCGEYYASLPYGYSSEGVERSGLAQLPFFQGQSCFALNLLFLTKLLIYRRFSVY